MIGRAATSDWCLPDPAQHISSRHCEVRYADGRFELLDHSTNGTFLFGQSARLGTAYVVRQGDVFVVGQYEIVASLDDASAAAAADTNAAAAEPEWRGWNAFGGQPEAAAPANASAWGAVPTGSAISGSGPMSQNWAPPAAQGMATDSHGAQPGASTWDVGPATPPPPPASDWSAPMAAPAPPAADDIWGKFAASNVVDWARGGFGSPNPAPAPATPAALGIASGGVDALGLRQGNAPPTPFGQAPAAAPDFGSSPQGGYAATPPPPAAPEPQQQATPQQQAVGGLAILLNSIGVEANRLKHGEAETLAQAGELLRQLIAGLVVLLEARARAKSQLGAQSTNLEFDGNNPLKFARSPEQALAQLLNPPERGFMSSGRAVEDAFKDLQAHQMATLKAMQGALRATLDRFSPTAIRARAENRGILSKIIPAARDAALWAAYEKEFSGVAGGSDEAFMDMFAKEFRRAYDEISVRR